MNPKKPFRPDSRQTEKLVQAGRDAGRDAIRTSKEHGLDVTYINNGIIYKESVDGTKEIIGRIADNNDSAVSVTKGMILRARS
jgi:hypothetical protein